MAPTSATPRSPAERDAMILAEIPHARRAAMYAYKRVCKLVPLEDLEQEAILGVIKAVHRFEERDGVQFHTFVDKRITGAIWDFIRTFSHYRRKLHEAPILLDEAILNTYKVDTNFE